MRHGASQPPNAWEKSSDLFASWSAWAAKAGEYIGTQKRFLGLIETRGLTRKRDNNGDRGFEGFRLKPRLTGPDTSNRYP